MLFSRHSRLLFASSLSLLILESLVGQVQRADAISIKFDYRYDTGFFTGANSGRQTLLNQAADYFENYITDSLPALQPGAGESLTFTFTNPNTGTSTSLSSTTDSTVKLAQDELLIFVGSRELNSTTLGIGTKGGSSGSFNGSSTFFDDYQTRKSEASTWGGAIAFDPEYNASTAPDGTNWYFGSNTSGLDNSKTDFLSVAIHELAHVMGFGSGTNWNSQVSGTNFTGAKSQQIYGSSVPLALDKQHWNDTLTINGLETAMDTTITDGDRKLLTSLDYAGLDDIGWDVSSSAYATPVPFEVSPRLGIFLLGIFWGTKKTWTTWKSKTGIKELSQKA